MNKLFLYMLNKEAKWQLVPIQTMEETLLGSLSFSYGQMELPQVHMFLERRRRSHITVDPSQSDLVALVLLPIKNETIAG